MPLAVFQFDQTSLRLADVSSSIVSGITIKCTDRCSLEADSLSQPEFLCLNSDSKVVLFRVALVGERGPDYCSSLTEAMIAWVQGGDASVLVGGNRLPVDQECTVEIEVWKLYT